jgi:putative membrane protein insertion efficiency factor
MTIERPDLPKETTASPVHVHSDEAGTGGAANAPELELHLHEPRLRDMPVNIMTLPRWLLLGLIRLYQATFSRALPPDTCRFYPSCSHYGYQAIYKYGAIKGGLMAAWRVLRCNPFNPGGIDPVP